MFWKKSEKDEPEYYVDQDEYFKYLNEVVEGLGGDKWKRGIVIPSMPSVILTFYIQDVPVEDAIKLFKKKFPLKTR